MENNVILNTDSYKASHYLQYPPNAQFVSGYVESRGGIFKDSLFFGLQYVLKNQLNQPITMEDVEEGKDIFTNHGEPFNEEGWTRIVKEFGGYLPIEIQSVPEGTVMPVKNVLMQVKNTVPGFGWLTTYVEPMLMQLWYPITVATNSMECRKIIAKYLEQTGDPAGIAFKLHDFGLRGVSSMESAMVGGMAHLVNFMGTDTVPALRGARRFYNANMAGFSIPAAEHSTMTSWGTEREVDAYRNMLTQFAKPGSMVAVVSDSYDIYNAVESIWGGVLKQEVIDSGATLIIRPDSGDPQTVVCRLLDICGDKFGYTTNNKGYKVLNNCVRLIQGDGVNRAEIGTILGKMAALGWSADNIAFGMGGGLLQQVNRDDMKFAMKASAVSYNEDASDWVPFKKTPITDPGKNSKAGRLALWNVGSDNPQHWVTGQEDDYDVSVMKNQLKTVWKDGEMLVDDSLEDIRNRAWG
jgi:nicotinamide phosphoribosyltransferase